MSWKFPISHAGKDRSIIKENLAFEAAFLETTFNFVFGIGGASKAEASEEHLPDRTRSR
jgi:hypothetical protein